MPNSHPKPSLPVGAVPQIITWIREAGQIALSHFNSVEAHFKADNTLLTAADIEIQQFLERKLRSAFPHHAFIGEESTKPLCNGEDADAHPITQPDADKSPYVWAVDPLDGTTAFALGLPGWGISVGLLYNGHPCLGFFYMPLQDDLTYTTLDGQLYWNDELLTQPICATWLPKRFLAVNATAHADYAIDIRGTRSLGSIGANLVYTARGAAACAFAAKAKLWDLVACAAIIHAAGGEITYIDGTSIEYLSLLDGRTVEQPIIAGHPDILTTLPQRIVPHAKTTPTESIPQSILTP